MNKLISVTATEDIFLEYQDTPIGRLLEYHNLHRPLDKYTKAELLIGMCMDNRKHLTIPDNFAFILRSGGGNLQYSAFKVSYAIAIGGVKAIALIGHSNCGMVNLQAKKEGFTQGLIDCGWEPAWAEEHFEHFAPLFEIHNEVDFVISEAKRLRGIYNKVLIAPLLYKVEDNRLYLIEE